MFRNVLLLALLLTSFLYSQVTISGDARIRPRYDINDKTASGGDKTADFYYMYRARLRVSANIGDGWGFSTVISHNGISDYSDFDMGDYPDVNGVNQSTAKPSSNESSRRATLSFMELYFGKEVENYGFRGGLIPLGSMNNPIYDLHYYPAKMVDIPFYIYNTDATYGASAYLKLGTGKLGVKVLVEDNRGKEEENPAGAVVYDVHDQYTFELSYSDVFEGFTIAPMALISISRSKDSLIAPNTFGLNVTSPKFADFTFQATYGYSFSNVSALRATQDPGYPATKFDASLLRLKLSGPAGPGNVLAWVDFGNMTEKPISGDVKDNFFFTWVAYEIPVFKSDKGAVSITPEVRYAKYEKNSAKTSDRLKTEVNFDIKF